MLQQKVIQVLKGEQNLNDAANLTYAKNEKGQCAIGANHIPSADMMKVLGLYGELLTIFIDNTTDEKVGFYSEIDNIIIKDRNPAFFEKTAQAFGIKEVENFSSWKSIFLIKETKTINEAELEQLLKKASYFSTPSKKLDLDGFFKKRTNQLYLTHRVSAL